jgi:hypothetical protein
VSTVSEDAVLTWLSFSLGCIQDSPQFAPMRYSPPSRRPMQPYIDLQQQPVRPRPRAPLPLDGAAEGVSDGGTRQEHQRRGMLPLYAARIEDLGVGDFVKVDYAACHHVELLAPEFLLRLGCSAQTKVLDLNERVRCRGCGKRGRAAVSIKWRRQSG